MSPALAGGFFTTVPPGKPDQGVGCQNYKENNLNLWKKLSNKALLLNFVMFLVYDSFLNICDLIYHFILNLY